MRFETVGRDKPERVFLAVRNAEATVDIPMGSPVCFTMNGTNNGNDVVLPTTGGVLKGNYLFAGVAVEAIPNRMFGYAQVFGYCQGAILVQRTRAASTDSWSSVDTRALGVPLALNVVENSTGNFTIGGLTYSVQADGFTEFSANAFEGVLPYAILASSQASIAGSASSTNNTSTIQTARVPVFLRAM